MNEFAVARALHVLGVVLWIGGVIMVTTILLPAATRIKPVSEWSRFFNHIEHHFARQARVATLLVGLSGFYMVSLLDAWHRFTELRFWWMHAMVLVWLVFSVMLFIVEPFIFNRPGRKQSQPHDLENNLSRIQRMHWILLTLSLITIAGAVAGSHGGLLSGGQ